jgi:cytochrome c-type biogenesis protein CcmH
MSYVSYLSHALVSAALAMCAITASAQAVSPLMPKSTLEPMPVPGTGQVREAAPMADDPKLEARLVDISQELRCLVKDFLVARYGDFVLYRPEVKPLTWVLWFGPFVLLLVAAVLMGIYLRQRRQQVQPAPLSEADRARAQKILKA